MMPALECYRHAAQCERLARTSEDPANRDALLSIARQWQELGDTAAMHAARIGGSYSLPSPDMPSR
jgi:hypothetical protein